MKLNVSQGEWSRVNQMREFLDPLTIDKGAAILEIMEFSGPAIEAYIRVRLTGRPDAWTGSGPG